MTRKSYSKQTLVNERPGPTNKPPAVPVSQKTFPGNLWEPPKNRPLPKTPREGPSADLRRAASFGKLFVFEDDASVLFNVNLHSNEANYARAAKVWASFVFAAG